MLININTNLSLNEIEDILSDKICSKYPKRYSENTLGINWVKNSKRFICLFYEDGTKGKWGEQTTVKSFFYGRVIKNKNKYKIIGISCVNIFFIFATLILYFLIAFCTNDSYMDTIFGIIFLTIIVFLFNLNIGKGNREIKKYLERIFS